MEDTRWHKAITRTGYKYTGYWLKVNGFPHK